MPHQQWKTIGEKELAALTRTFPLAEARNILRAAEGDFVYRNLSPAAKKAHEELVAQLAREFENGAAIMILNAADRAAKKHLKENRKVEN